jgi:predicted GNAT family acetyltransferase
VPSNTKTHLNNHDLRRVPRRHTRQNRPAPPNTRAIVTIVRHDQAVLKFTADVEGRHAELDYAVAGSVMTITHTRVPKPIEGRGIAAELMRSAMQYAREKNWSVNPACSYAAAYLQRHPQDAARQHVEDLLDEALDESFPASDSPSVGGST